VPRDGRSATYARRPAVDDRGQSLSVFALVVVTAMFLTAGLVIDGGQQTAARSRAESVAAGAARAGGNAAATGAVVGALDAPAALQAAKDHLAASPGVTGNVALSNGKVVVETRSEVPTIFLSAIGIRSLIGTGRAEARIVGSVER
jgi:hypothetical protein